MSSLFGMVPTILPVAIFAALNFINSGFGCIPGAPAAQTYLPPALEQAAAYAYGQGMNARDRIAAGDSSSNSAASTISARDIADFVNRVRQNATSVNATSELGDTSLIVMAAIADTETASLLLDRGARVNATVAATDNSTALIMAARFGNTDTAYMLLSRNADVNFANVLGYTALIAAAESGFAGFVNLLLDFGAKMDLRTKAGQTAIYAAARTFHADVVLSLAMRGANVNLADNAGVRPVTIAAKVGSTDSVRFLLKFGANTTGCNYPLCSSGGYLTGSF